jgi:hypothetical protein
VDKIKVGDWITREGEPGYAFEVSEINSTGKLIISRRWSFKNEMHLNPTSDKWFDISGFVRREGK